MVSVVTAFSMSAIVAFADDAATADVAEPAAVEEVVDEEAVEEEAEEKEEPAVSAGEDADAATPAADEAAPAADEAAPAADEAAPAADEAAPAADEAAPAADEAAPAADEAAPAADETTPATDATTPATDETTPATDATTPATDATTPATDATTPATDETDPAAQPDPNATANQTVFIDFVDLPNATDKDDTVRSHVDSRAAGEKQVNYYVVGTTGSTSGNSPVGDYTAYLTFAKWALKDTDGNTLVTSEDVESWSWDIDITGATSYASYSNIINWDIKKEFQKSELVEQSYRYLYDQNLYNNGMAKNTRISGEEYNMTANKVILNIDYNGTRYSVDMTDKDNPFYFLYHKGQCKAFGFVTSQQSKEIKISTAPAPQTCEPSSEPECVKTCAKHYWKCAKKVKQCDVPKTGDAQMSYTVLAALVLMLGGALVLTEKKRRAI